MADIKAGTILRFAQGTKTVADATTPVMTGYVTGVDKLTGMLRVCTKPGTYWDVDPALADIV